MLGRTTAYFEPHEGVPYLTYLRRLVYISVSYRRYIHLLWFWVRLVGIRVWFVMRCRLICTKWNKTRVFPRTRPVLGRTAGFFESLDLFVIISHFLGLVLYECSVYGVISFAMVLGSTCEC